MACTPSGPIEIPVGGDAEFTFQLTNNGTPIDITNDVVTLYVAVTKDKPNLLTKSTDVPAEAIKTDPAIGKVKFIFTPDDTDVDNGGLKAKAYVYDIWIETLAGKHKRMCAPSPFTVSEGVGR